MSEKEQKIEFPTTWSYRIITDAANKDCPAAILDVLKEYGIKAKLEKKDKSSNGKYQAYRLPVVFESQEMMNDLSSRLSVIGGVKFLL
jgi:putative lipoic acid-binding regulatory protein